MQFKNANALPNIVQDASLRILNELDEDSQALIIGARTTSIEIVLAQGSSQLLVSTVDSGGTPHSFSTPLRKD